MADETPESTGTPAEPSSSGAEPAQPPAVPAAAENAIGTLNEGGANESAGGDPNSPADRALESALQREQKLADDIVQDAAQASEPLAADEQIASNAVAEMSDVNALEAAAEADTATVTDPKELERVVEALLFAAMEPISVRELARAADSDSPTIRKVLKALKETGDRERRPWDLVEIANAWRLMTRPEFHGAIQRLKTQTSQRKLTQAALETLALIAYRQPLGRAEIESIRGVNAGPVLRLLLEKKLIQIAGRGTGAGQPLLYGTTDYFLENFGLKSLAELPKPGEFKNA
jgi:segregation and condensation protein B